MGFKEDQLKALKEARFSSGTRTKGGGVIRPVPHQQGAGSSEDRAVLKAGDAVSMGRVASSKLAQPVAKKHGGRPLEKDRVKSLAALKPWEKEGMSRRTWFRRRAEDRE